MIRIIGPHDYARHQQALREMRRLRHRVFKERLQWDVQSVDGEERDEYDALDPTYLLAVDEADAVVGSWRLLPTTGPYMLKDTFSQFLVGIDPPVDPLVWECSRFAVECDDGRKDCLASVNHITSEMFCGLAEFSLERGLRAIVSLYDIRIARMLPRIGCPPKWSTRPQRIGNTSAVAGLFEVSAAALAAVRRVGGIEGSVIEPGLPLETIEARAA